MQEGIYFEQACHLNVRHVLCYLPAVEQLVPPSSVVKCKPVRCRSPIRAVSQEFVKRVTRLHKTSRKDVSKWAVDSEMRTRIRSKFSFCEPDLRPPLPLSLLIPRHSAAIEGKPLMEPASLSTHECRLTDPLTL